MRQGTKKWKLVQASQKVIDQYKKLDMRLTLRQIYYRLVASEVIENTVLSYQYLGQALTQARKERIIDPAIFEDRTRSSDVQSDNIYTKESWWKNWIETLERNVTDYKIDRWALQPKKVFIVLEKQALQSVFGQVCDELGLTLIIGRGYHSYTQIYEVGKQIVEESMVEAPKGKKMIFLTFGDHDPSGLDIVRNFEVQMINEGVKRAEFSFVAITPEQILNYNLPPAPMKKRIKKIKGVNTIVPSDARGKKFIEKYGDAVVELDAIEPGDLQKMIRTEADKYFNEEIYDTSIKPYQNEHRAYFKVMFDDSKIKTFDAFADTEVNDV